MRVWVLNINEGESIIVFDKRNTALAYLQKSYKDVKAYLYCNTDTKGDIRGYMFEEQLEDNPTMLIFTVEEHAICRME
jgi:hypothetical protein